MFAMTTGGLIAGFTVAILAGVVARTTELKEDASLATFYLVSLALGVTIVSVKGTNVDLLHFLFGSVLALCADAQQIESVAAAFDARLDVGRVAGGDVRLEVFEHVRGEHHVEIGGRQAALTPGAPPRMAGPEPAP